MTRQPSDFDLALAREDGIEWQRLHSPEIYHLKVRVARLELELEKTRRDVLRLERSVAKREGLVAAMLAYPAQFLGLAKS